MDSERTTEPEGEGAAQDAGMDAALAKLYNLSYGSGPSANCQHQPHTFPNGETWCVLCWTQLREGK